MTWARMDDCRDSSRSLSKSFDGISDSREREDLVAKEVAGMDVSSMCASVTESLVFAEGPVCVIYKRSLVCKCTLYACRYVLIDSRVYQE